MFPRHHILLGFIFSGIFWAFFPSTNLIYILLIFLSSFLIDFDHYVVAVIKNKHLSLKKAFDYHDKKGKREAMEHKKGLREKGDFHILHTIEVLVFVAFLGFFWKGFFYVSIGMIFHSLLDISFLVYRGIHYKREFILGNWISKNLCNYIKR